MSVSNKVLSSALGLITATTLVGYSHDATAALLFDRGLPSQNLNNAAGANRSNIRWATDAQNQGFFGDDFTIGSVGETYTIDTLRVWVVPGLSIGDPNSLNDFFNSVSLLVGGSAGSNLTSLASTTNFVSDPNISFTKVTYPDGTNATTYDNFGTLVNLWQVDFSNLNWTIDGGVEYSFGVKGIGKQIGASTIFYPWFNHGSNAALSGSTQDGADDRLLEFDASGNFVATINSDGDGFDKSTDINVQVFGELQSAKTPEPGTWLATILAVGMTGTIKKKSFS